MNGTATERSINFLVNLSAERTPHVTEAVIREWAKTVPWQTVSAKIDELKKLPVAAKSDNETVVEIPAGRYAIDSLNTPGETRFYKIDRPTEGRWAGYTFVKVQAGDEHHDIRNRQQRAAILAQIAKDGVQAAMERYGRELGHCGHCGRTLTNDESRERGIGPVCAGKIGW
jgi:hypothetical protein